MFAHFFAFPTSTLINSSLWRIFSRISLVLCLFFFLSYFLAIVLIICSLFCLIYLILPFNWSTYTYSFLSLSFHSPPLPSTNSERTRFLYSFFLWLLSPRILPENYYVCTFFSIFFCTKEKWSLIFLVWSGSTSFVLPKQTLSLSLYFSSYITSHLPTV